MKQNTNGPQNVIDHYILLRARNITKEKIKEIVTAWIDELTRHITDSLQYTEGYEYILLGIIVFAIITLCMARANIQGTYIPNPPGLRGKMCIFNPQFADNNCVVRTIVSFKLQ